MYTPTLHLLVHHFIQQVMSLDLCTVPDNLSFCNCNCILKDFHDFKTFIYSKSSRISCQYSHSKEHYLNSIPKYFSADKYCKH